MIRLPEVKSCFLRDSIGDVPRPADLLNLIQLVSLHSHDAVLNPRFMLLSILVGPFLNAHVRFFIFVPGY